MKWHSTVLEGAGRGTRMKLPTINFVIPKGFPYPYGIYAGYVVTAGTRHVAAIHYGPIPTFQSKRPTLEAFVLSGNISLLPPLEIELMRYLREIRTYPDAPTLRAAIDLDVNRTRQTFANEKADH